MCQLAAQAGAAAVQSVRACLRQDIETTTENMTSQQQDFDVPMTKVS
jgi:hypothetical protein